jgi:hypothetical protein
MALINPGPYGMAGLSNVHPQSSGKFSGLATIAKPYHSNEISGLSPGLGNTENAEGLFSANNCFLYTITIAKLQKAENVTSRRLQHARVS